MDPDPSPLPYFLDFDPAIVAPLLLLGILLVGSAFASASEVAFFSLDPTEREKLKESRHPGDVRAVGLLKHAEKLLATLLVVNNAFNLSIVLLGTWIGQHVFDFSAHPGLILVVDVIGLTTIILIFGEILPKSYAATRPAAVVRKMSLSVSMVSTALAPLSQWLIAAGKTFGEPKNARGLSVDDLENALDITTRGLPNDSDENQLLRGIVRFGGVSVKQIMAQRPNIVALSYVSSFPTVMQLVIDKGYSRVPVFKDTLDHVVGILHTKDLLPYLDAKESFEWQELLRKPLFVPESMKIDDLLRDFQNQKMHMALVVDEYGGTSGLVTLEDVMEEIVGEIADEFDEEEVIYSRLDDKTCLFEARTPLNDVLRILDLDANAIDEWRGEADALAGLVLNTTEGLPRKGHICFVGPLKMTVEAVDKRRIVRVKVQVLSEV